MVVNVFKKERKKIVANTRKTTGKKSQGDLGGFTIIEVVLVLAIAGLIFLMVFIALPALQRSQRDTQRRNDLARISTGINNYQTNNNGKLPGDGKVEPYDSEDSTTPDITTWCSSAAGSGSSGTGTNTTAACFIRNYMNSVNATENEFTDPDGWSYGLEIKDMPKGATGVSTSMNGGTDRFTHLIEMYKHAKCNGETAEYSSNARDYAIMYKLEGNGTYCADNGS